MADPAAGCGPESCLPFPGSFQAPQLGPWGCQNRAKGLLSVLHPARCSLSAQREESYLTGKGVSNKSLASFAHVLRDIVAFSWFVSPLFLSVE